MIKNKNKKHVSKFVCAGLIAGVVTCCPFALANAPVSQSVSDLEGTTWIFNETIIFPDDLAIEAKIVFDVSLTVAGVSYTSFVLWYDYFGSGGYQMSYYDGNADDFVYDTIDFPSWSSDLYKEVSFTGGADSTNATLISFMEENGVLQSSPASNLDLYDQIFQILSDYIFGGQVTQDDMSYKALILTAGSTILTVLMVSLPFLAVFGFIKLFF